MHTYPTPHTNTLAENSIERARAVSCRAYTCWLRIYGLVGGGGAFVLYHTPFTSRMYVYFCTILARGSHGLYICTYLLVDMQGEHTRRGRIMLFLLANARSLPEVHVYLGFSKAIFLVIVESENKSGYMKGRESRGIK